MNDRQQDNWRLLIGIADAAGGSWPAKARAAALALSAVDEDADSIGVQLLASVQIVFGTAKQISTENLLKHLHAMSEAPWGEYGRQRKPITPRQLATLLRPFAIASGTIREGDTTPKGYRRVQFEDAWARYLVSSATTPPPQESATFGDFPSATPDPDVADRSGQKARETATCGVVADGDGIEPGGDGTDEPWADDPAESCSWKRENHEPPCCHCSEPILVSEDRISRDDGELIHRRCFAAGSSRAGHR